MCEIPYAVMQPYKPIKDVMAEIISGPQKSLQDVFRAKAYLERVQNEPRNSLGEGLLDSCTNRLQHAVRLYHLAVIWNQLIVMEQVQVFTYCECDFESIQAFVMQCGPDMPLDEVVRLLDSDLHATGCVGDSVWRTLEPAVREMSASQVDMADGTSLTWFEIRNEIQAHFREIQSLFTDMQRLYGECERWLRDFPGYDDREPCDPEQYQECLATGEDCEACVLGRSEPYKLAAHLLRDYDQLLTDHLDAVTEIIEFLVHPETNSLRPMWIDESDIYDALEADVERYINTPEMSAKNLRENYKLAIIEDNRIPMDGQTVIDYDSTCFVIECGRPYVFSHNLNWALRVMNVALDHPALQVKALVTTIEQAKAASAAREMQVS